MVDTIRTLAAIQALLADNTTRDISPQDIRDAIQSLTVFHCNLHDHNNALYTAIATVNTWTEVALTAPAIENVSAFMGSNDFDQPVAGRIRYLGSVTRIFKIDTTISVKSAGNNKSFEFALGVNGSTDHASAINQRMSTGTDEQALSTMLLTPLNLNDYVSLFVRNVTDDTDILIAHINTVILSLIT